MKLSVVILVSVIGVFGTVAKAQNCEKLCSFEFLKEASSEALKAEISRSDLEATRDGETALMVAVDLHRLHPQKSAEVMQILLNAGADFNAKETRDDWTVLMIAVAKYSPEAVKMLLDSGVDFNAKNYEGETALMFATHRSEIPRNYDAQIQILKLLLNAGADLNTKTRMGKTALYFAELWGTALQVKMLKDAGAK
jgi:ankyrin repeat protein